MDDENGRYRWGATDEGPNLVPGVELAARLRGNTPWNVSPEWSVKVRADGSEHALRSERRVTRGVARLPEPVR